MARPDHDVAPASDERFLNLFIDLCDERDMILEINVHEKGDFSFGESTLRTEEAPLQRLRAGVVDYREHVFPIIWSERADFYRATVAEMLHCNIGGSIQHDGQFSYRNDVRTALAMSIWQWPKAGG